MGTKYLHKIWFLFLERFIIISLNGHLIYALDSTAFPLMTRTLL